MENSLAGDTPLRTERTVVTIYGEVTLMIQAGSYPELRVLHLLATASLQRSLHHLLPPSPEQSPQ